MGDARECVILVDNSNIYIEGQKCSAFRKGQRERNPDGKPPVDFSWSINYANLLRHLADGRNIRSAILVGSRPPPLDAVWLMAKRSGFKVITHERDAANKEKAVDTELVVQGTLILATTTPGILVIGSGDRDFVPLVKVAHQLKWAVEMVTFASAFSKQGEMATTVDKVRRLDGSLDLIGYSRSGARAKKTEKPPSSRNSSGSKPLVR
jgi:uncharacterized LabA/DUF88 family protein